ncbi:MAG: hypothetical protein ABJN42_09965 [Roseibium sp.]|uniref:hypothetical protein n=1 Tax=Roseibium sp. TaxID=1936156 RepID=UPI003296BB5B
MVWVVPTMAAAGFFAGSISIDEKSTRRQLDEGDDGGEEGDSIEEDDASSDLQHETVDIED